MRRLIYAVPADLGSGGAHTIHVVKMGHALGLAGERVDVVVRDAPTSEKLSEMFSLSDGFDVIRIGGRKPLWRSLRFAAGVAALARRGDSVFTRNLMTALIMSLLGFPTVLELHSPLETLRERIQFQLFLSASGMRGFVTITKALAARFLEDFGERLTGKIHVLPDAAEPRLSQEYTNDGRRGATVGYIGGFLPGKGVDLVLRVAALMPDVRFQLVGGTAEDVLDHEIPNNVIFAGRLTHADAMMWLDQMDVVLLPNQRRVFVSGGRIDIGAWTSPLKLFEYMAAGKGIVASRLPVLQEILEHERNCLLAAADSPEEWSEQIRRMISSPSFAESLGDQARKELLANYTWSARASKILRIFEEGRPT